MELLLDALLDALIDGVKMLPFLYLAYLLIEWLERHHGENIENALAGGAGCRDSAGGGYLQPERRGVSNQR